MQGVVLGVGHRVLSPGVVTVGLFARHHASLCLLGTPQGLSVFLDGMRINEAFGDTVAWDLVPQIAIANAMLVPGSNPVYGLNTLGGAINYAMGYGANKAFTHERQSRWFGWLQRFGPKTLLLSWLPIIGDPLCALAGWLQLPFWRCVLWMATGKLLRYLFVTQILLEVPDSVWHRLLTLW